mgnify:FL=1|jgi:hypothetical protein|tara:strand:- start:20 stop:514 length:495 start_codon:yes stop_codon:yes gene_type:complete
MKVFAIGFNRCGTQSLFKFFANNGFKALHCRGSSKIVDNHINSKPLLQGYEDYTFFSDIDFLSRHFELFAVQYPEAKFIYNYREVEGWIRSRKKLWTANNWVIDEPYWRAEWKYHHTMLKEYFCGGREKRLLEFDIEKAQGESIAKFLPELAITKMHFPKVDWL